MADNSPKSNRSNTLAALGLAWDLGYTIAVPLVVLALIGRLADRSFGTSPWLLLTGVLFSIIISTLLVVRKTRAIMEAANTSPPEHTDRPSDKNL